MLKMSIWSSCYLTMSDFMWLDMGKFLFLFFTFIYFKDYVLFCSFQWGSLTQLGSSQCFARPLFIYLYPMSKEEVKISAFPKNFDGWVKATLNYSSDQKNIHIIWLRICVHFSYQINLTFSLYKPKTTWQKQKGMLFISRRKDYKRQSMTRLEFGGTHFTNS